VLAPDFGVALEASRNASAERAAALLREVQADLEARPVPATRDLVSGQDLMALGHVPGPQFKRILASLEDEIYERRIATRDDAIAWVKQRFSSVP
jgi:hypothetical protein